MEVYKGRWYRETAELFLEKFGIDLSNKQIQKFLNDRGLSNGMDGTFRNGHTAPMKGRHFEHGGAREDVLPIGFERIRGGKNRHPGYIEVKTAPGVWRPKSFLVWEAAHGPVPDGMILIYLDGDPMNCTLENLMLISRRENCRINRTTKRTDSPELNKAIVLSSRLAFAVSDRRRERHEDQ